MSANSNLFRAPNPKIMQSVRNKSNQQKAQINNNSIADN